MTSKRLGFFMANCFVYEYSIAIVLVTMKYSVNIRQNKQVIMMMTMLRWQSMLQKALRNQKVKQLKFVFLYNIEC